MMVVGCLCRSMGGEVTTDGDFLIFEGNRYSRKGFLFKSFVMSAIVSSTLAWSLGKTQLLLHTFSSECFSVMQHSYWGRLIYTV